ncbi:MAG: sugar ABC transporter permease [Clostridia bacterium]|nr:sugar ABC transporter permease [Clostridia bacterium]
MKLPFGGKDKAEKADAAKERNADVLLRPAKKKKKVKGDAKEIKRIASLDKKKARAGWLFVLPFIIGFLLIYIPIISRSIQYSFSKLNSIAGGGLVAENVMFTNYSNALRDEAFVSTLLGGLRQLALEIPAILFFSLFVAILLNQKMVGRSAFRAIFFIPVILATGLISGIDSTTSNASTAENTISTGSSASSIVTSEDIQALFSNMIVGSELAAVVTGFVNNIFDIVNRSGVQMLIFLAGLQGISPSVYESCEMEGASAWETFWKITLPMISPMILVNLVYTLIDSFTAGSNSVMSYIASVYSNSASGGLEKASAMYWFYFMTVMLIVGAIAAIIGRVVFYQRRD